MVTAPGQEVAAAAAPVPGQDAAAETCRPVGRRPGIVATTHATPALQVVEVLVAVLVAGRAGATPPLAAGPIGARAGPKANAAKEVEATVAATVPRVALVARPAPTTEVPFAARLLATARTPVPRTAVGATVDAVALRVPQVVTFREVQARRVLARLARPALAVLALGPLPDAVGLSVVALYGAARTPVVERRVLVPAPVAKVLVAPATPPTAVLPGHVAGVAATVLETDVALGAPFLGVAASPETAGRPTPHCEAC